KDLARNFLWASEGFIELTRREKWALQLENALLLATLMFDPETVYRLLKCGANPNVRSFADKSSPLLIAIAFQRSDLTDILLRHGADPNFAGPRVMLPLTAGIRYRSFDCFSTLLKYGADPTKKDLNGIAPVTYSLGRR